MTFYLHRRAASPPTRWCVLVPSCGARSPSSSRGETLRKDYPIRFQGVGGAGATARSMATARFRSEARRPEGVSPVSIGAPFREAEIAPTNSVAFPPQQPHRVERRDAVGAPAIGHDLAFASHLRDARLGASPAGGSRRRGCDRHRTRPGAGHRATLPCHSRAEAQFVVGDGLEGVHVRIVIHRDGAYFGEVELRDLEQEGDGLTRGHPPAEARRLRQRRRLTCVAEGLEKVGAPGKESPSGAGTPISACTSVGPHGSEAGTSGRRSDGNARHVEPARSEPPRPSIRSKAYSP